MVNQQEVDRLTQELQSLRGAIVRKDRRMAERVDRMIRDAHRMHEEAIGTNFEPALRSVEDLLGCVKRGMNARCTLDRSLRQAG